MSSLKQIHRAGRSGYACCALLVCLSVCALPSHAARVVNCDEAGLDAALAEAQAAGGTVVFACNGTITVTSPKVITNHVTLDGTGHEVVISGGDATRIFFVEPGVEFTLEALTVSNARVVGVDGRDGVPGSENGKTGIAAEGGAMFNDGGIVTIRHCTFSTNTVIGGNGGNGLSAGGCETAGDGRYGASGRGAAIYSLGGSLHIEGSTFVGNLALGGNGGAGGTGGNCGFGTDGGDGGSGGRADGACLYLDATVASIVNSTFANNLARGGDADAGGNGIGALGRGGDGGRGGSSRGGAIFASGSSLVSLNHCTIATNACFSGQRGAKGLGGSTNLDGENGNAGLRQGECFYNLSSTSEISIRNSILSGTTGDRNCWGSIIDGGNNISSDDCPISPYPRTDPRLKPLRDNGGLTMTMALDSGSDARDAISDGTALPFDQRGFPRVAQPDIGAFEFRINVVTLNTLISPVKEDESINGIIEAERSGPFTNAVTINLSFGGTAVMATNGDYTVPNFPIIIPANESIGRILIDPVPDTIREADKIVEVTLEPGEYEVVPGPDKARVTLLDDDMPPLVSIQAIDRFIAENATDTAAIRFSRTATTIEDLDVSVIVDGTAVTNRDYNFGGPLVATNVFQIPAGSSSADLLIAPIDKIPADDNPDDSNTWVRVTLDSNADYPVDITNRVAQVTILDNDGEPELEVVGMTNGVGFTLTFLSSMTKTYDVQRQPFTNMPVATIITNIITNDLFLTTNFTTNDGWVTTTNLNGTGSILEYLDREFTNEFQYYRLRVLDRE